MRPLLLLSALAVSVSSVMTLSSCKMMRAITPDISLPKLGLPSRNTIAAIIPGMGPEDKASGEDPQVPFNSRGTLGYGHTLRFEVYEGARSASRVYSGIVMVDTEGLLALGEVGSARVGGLRLPQAAEAIATAFRLGGKHTRPLTVHIVSVENTPVVSINGDVREAEFIPAFENMGVKHAVTVVGGRKQGSAARGVYIAREGQRNFFTSIESAEARWQPRAGDIITLSPDI
ncbi:MAG: hypothetical protein ACO1TE_14620 [Prosthecobacter sp.]